MAALLAVVVDEAAADQRSGVGQEGTAPLVVTANSLVEGDHSDAQIVVILSTDLVACF